jgi:hypothetical protein
MKQLQAIKTVWITKPGAIVDDAAFTTDTIDTKGFRSARIVVGLGALDIALAAMKLQQSDASNMASASDVSGADFSVLPLTLPSATDDNKLYAIHVDLKGKKRYLDLTLTGGDGANGTYATAWVDLYDAEEYPNSAEERGFAQEAFV